MQKESAILTGGEVRNLLSRCVYAWQREEEWLYVGQTTNGVARFGNHHAITRDRLLDSDRIVLWHVATEPEALLLEAELIDRYSPLYNRTTRVERTTKPARRDRKKHDHLGRMTPAEFQARVEHHQREYFRLHPKERPIVRSYDDVPLPAPQSSAKRTYFKAHKRSH